MSRWRALVARALADRWESLPLLATFSGVRGYDHVLGEVSAEAIDGRLRVKRALIRDLESFKPRGTPQILDHKVLRGQLKVSVREIESYRRLSWDASLYPLTAVRSVHILLVRDLPASYRREMVSARLRRVPAYLAEGLSNLKSIDRRMGELALEACRSGDAFLRDAAEALDPGACRRAREALAGYAAEVRSRLLPGARRRYPAGRELFEYKLRHEHGLPYGAEELLELGRKAVAETRAALARAAREIAPGRDWRGLLAGLKKDSPDISELLDVYRRETRRARAFCVRRRLVSLPPGERLDVVATPRFEWDTSPYAALLPGGPFEKPSRSVFWVTPVDPSWPEAKQRARLQGHCLHGLPSVCAHEGYPGHHVQLLRARRSSDIRSVFSTPVLVEGWALYCEQMMEEEGFMPDPRARLYRLKDQLWRACRVVVDVGLHARGWSPERAQSYLVREALLEPPNARAEVNRYCTSATQPMSYLVGKLEILKLRRLCRARWGGSFGLRRFHDWLLDFGSMPPSWIASSGSK